MRADDNEERSGELEDSELNTVAGGVSGGENPPPEDDGTDPTGSYPNPDGTITPDPDPHDPPN